MVFEIIMAMTFFRERCNDLSEQVKQARQYGQDKWEGLYIKMCLALFTVELELILGFSVKLDALEKNMV